MEKVDPLTAVWLGAKQSWIIVATTISTRRCQVRAEKAGVAAYQKVIIPLVLFIMPAVMLMIFGPFALEYFSSGGM